MLFLSLRVCATALLLLLALFPVADWLGITLNEMLVYAADDWWSNTVMIGLGTGLLVWLWQRGDPNGSVEALWARLTAWWSARPGIAIPLLSLCASSLYTFDALWIFEGRPLLIDEIVQVVQAQWFADGLLWRPAGPVPELQSAMHLAEVDSRVFGQFPAGGPAMLALGVLAGAPWLVNPLFGGVAVAGFALALRWGGWRPGVSLGASALFAFCPFVVFMSASHMNHVTALAWLLVSSAALAYTVRAKGDHGVAGFIVGLGLGLSATIRPLDAMLWAIPMGGWLAWRALTLGTWRALGGSGVGVLLPIAALLAVNSAQTGAPLLFGYVALWGPDVGLGFHESPWGDAHTWQRGLAMTATYLNRLNDHLFETPVPALVPVALVLLLGRRTRPMERLWVMTGLATLLAYFAYWHDGYYLGPRFLLPLVPVLVLAVAQLPSVLASRFAAHARLCHRGVLAAFVVAGVAGVVLMVPVRLALYRVLFASMRPDYSQLAAFAGATSSDDLVIVRESWGAQLVARLWALEIPRGDAERLFRQVDACVLDVALRALETHDLRGAPALARLLPLRADSLRAQPSPFSPDQTERYVAGTVYDDVCLQRIVEDRAGFAHFAPALLAVRGRPDSAGRSVGRGPQWSRDLQARSAAMASPGGRVWLLRLVREDGQAPRPVLERIDGDSLRRAWGASAPR